MSPHLSICTHCPLCPQGTKLSPVYKIAQLGQRDKCGDKFSLYAHDLSSLDKISRRTILSPQTILSSRGTILSPGDNILEFCPFVPCIAKFVPFYGDKFGDLYSLQGSSCRMSLYCDKLTRHCWIKWITKTMEAGTDEEPRCWLIRKDTTRYSWLVEF